MPFVAIMVLADRFPVRALFYNFIISRGFVCFHPKGYVWPILALRYEQSTLPSFCPDDDDRFSYRMFR